MLLRRALRQAGYGGHDLTEAENGALALASIQDAAPDLVLSDWNMPEMDGITLLTTLRDEGCSVTFGFITSEATTEMRERAASAGASFLLAKPFTPDKLRDALSVHAP